MKDYTTLLRLHDIEKYATALKKLTITPKLLEENDKSFLLAFAVLLIRHYELDNSKKAFLELAYYIILNYSLEFLDFEPLYDFSVNFGFYPIAQVLTRDKLISFSSIEFDSIENLIKDKYSYKQIIQTKEQYRVFSELLMSENMELSFIAPTSYGKTSIIIEHISKNFNANKKFGIIVPNKSLLLQTALKVRKEQFPIKIITHDEMYSEGQNFIGIFTQERALRLLERNPISFDYLYIDEAQNLLERKPRSIRLTRLIEVNKLRNPVTKILYLSPLINNSENISINNNHIYEHKIMYNMKEPVYYEYNNQKQYRYDRFLDCFTEIRHSDSLYTYIKENSTRKSFIYISNPKDIELFSKKFSSYLPKIENSKIDSIIDTLSEYINPNFYEVSLLKHGIIYIHAKMPDKIKEYLEISFSRITEIKYIVANTVILEGVNLPIDSLFILSEYKLTHKNLINLIGRVNRLDKVFLERNGLSKLRPPIHFVENEEYKSARTKFENKIRSLKSNTMKDEVENPLLDKFEPPKEKDISAKKECERIRSEERDFFSDAKGPIENLKRKLLSLGLGEIYIISDDLCNALISNFTRYVSSEEDHFLDKLQETCIYNLEEYIKDKEVKRLKNKEAINYYKNFFEFRNRKLKDVIISEINYFEKRKRSIDSMLYIGSNGYAEIVDEENIYQKVYVELKNKTYEELVNLAIVKVKLEDDFISYKLNMLFQLMLDYEIITIDEYNYIIYGTRNEKIISLKKMGVSSDLINLLQENNQFEKIEIDDNKNIKVIDNSFLQFVDTINGFYKNELLFFL